MFQKREIGRMEIMFKGSNLVVRIIRQINLPDVFKILDIWDNDSIVKGLDNMLREFKPYVLDTGKQPDV